MSTLPRARTRVEVRGKPSAEVLLRGVLTKIGPGPVVLEVSPEEAERLAKDPSLEVRVVGFLRLA